MSNWKAYWESPSRADRYARHSHLFEAERKFISEFKEQMKDWTMLDLGVGGGRTTVHFAPLVNRYIGGDYSCAMIEQCTRRFPNFDVANIAELKLLDATDLRDFDDHTFDFVLFSCCGIDEMPEHERNKAIIGIKRVLKKGGRLLYSSHNIFSADLLFTFKFQRNPIRAVRMFRKVVLRRRENPSWRKILLERKSQAIFEYYYALENPHMYTNPSAELENLKKLGFAKVGVYDPSPDFIAEDPSSRAAGEDMFVDYLCYTKSAY